MKGTATHDAVIAGVGWCVKGFTEVAPLQGGREREEGGGQLSVSNTKK